MSKAVGFAHDNKNNISVDWYTPPSLFKEMGVIFDLDPCQPAGGIPWIPVWKYYTIQNDGLASPWNGRVWLNPPYGKYTNDWLAKMHQHRNGISLVFARTDCRWYHDYVAKADAILFLSGRIKFVDGLGSTNGSGSGCGSMLVAWGEQNVAVLERIREKGHLVKINC